MDLQQLQALIAGYDPSKNGYTQNTDGSRPNGWYANNQGSDNPVASNPYGGGSAFEKYLLDNGVGMWDPGNDSFKRVGATNKEAFDYLNPGATVYGTGSQIQGADPSLAGLQFHSIANPAQGNYFAGKDFGDHTGIQNQILDHGYMIPLGIAGAAAAAAAAGGVGGAADLGGGLSLDEFGNVGNGLFQGGNIAASDGLAAGDASWGVNEHLANPFTAPEIPETYEKALNLKAGGSALNPSPFNLQDFINKAPTTGNKVVDQILSKAAMSALTTGAGAANQLTAGEGGNTTGADQQAAEEARKQGLIDQINQMYSPDNFKGEEDDLSGAIRGQQGDALKLGYEKAARATTFDAARRGNVGGSVMADNFANLNRDNQLGATKIEDAVNSALAGLRSSRLASQGNAISLVNAGSGPEGVNAAATGIKNAIDTARAEKVPDVTQGLFQNVALSNQAINTGNNNASLNAYANARLNGGGGGGSLFSLGSRPSGYSVNVN